MAKILHDRKEIENSISLLVSILIRHPEVSTVNYEPGEKILSFSFILNKLLSDIEYEEFKTIIIDSLKAHSFLINCDCPDIEFNKTSYEKITIIEIERDVYSLTSDEINLIMALICHVFEKNLISDESDTVEDNDMQDEAIDNMLEDVKQSRHNKNLYGYRDNGKVMVFNKSVHKSKT